MANVAVIGIQWGDEGKGKIVDWLSARADVVARFQGGHNAGHTLVIDGVTYKLSLLPSGVVRKDKHSVIGNGVVVDPYAFAAEVDRLKKLGVDVSPDNLVIAENAPLILSLHRELDGMREAGAHSIGTTKRGIGPAYEDKIGRRAIRAIDLKHPETLPDKIERLLEHHNTLRRGADLPEYKVEDILKELTDIAPKIVPFLGPVWRVLDQARRENKKILFEGAQAVLLDIDHGTFPYVTSSNTVAGNAAAGCGISPHMINYVLGIAKAYTTRVGNGPFPTELTDDVGMHIGDRGKEFGTVTGRRRRCGWFDAVLVRQTALIGGVDGIALTKLDVLDDLDEIKICVGYKLDGEMIDYLPADPVDQARIEPVFETMEGWKSSSNGARRWADLPAGAIKYVRRIEELVGAPVSLLSTSPEREDTILVEDPFLS